MLDIAMLETIASPCGYAGSAPLVLDRIFAEVVRHGWTPRNPACESELPRLERSLVGGKCISPLLEDGDEIFIDNNMAPQSGDVVSFRLSQRGADVQNSDPPPGQSVQYAGNRWAKLYIDYHGLGMLLDRHGHSATATLLACEKPDGTPMLHPIRQIRRGGRLLFGPTAGTAPELFVPLAVCVAEATDIANNAVSQTVNTSSVGGFASYPLSGAVVDTDMITASITTIGGAVGVDASTDFKVFNSALNSIASCLITIQRDGSDIGTANFDVHAAQLTFSGVWEGLVTLTVMDAPSAAAHTYAFHVKGNSNVGSSGLNPGVTFGNPAIKCREYKR